MFRGEYYHSLDAKGRVSVPSKVRDNLGDSFIVTKGFEKCLYVYSNEEWDRIEQNFRNAEHTNKAARKFARFFFGCAVDCEVDKQGRVLLPTPLREYAGLEKEVVITGVFNRLEIWDKENWAEENTYDDMDDLADQISALGIEI